MIDLYKRGSAKFSWWKDWRGDCVAIIASGESASKVGVEQLRNRIHCVVINESYRLCPWADILYSCDAAWWALRWKEVQSFKGIKLSYDPVATELVKNLNKINIRQVRNIYVDDFLFDEAGTVGSGGHSGFQMINMVGQFGATGIALVGFDMRLMSKNIHWHGRHPDSLRNPDVSRFDVWRQTLDSKASQLTKVGIDVVNCSLDSALSAFPKMTIDQMLKRWTL